MEDGDINLPDARLGGLTFPEPPQGASAPSAATVAGLLGSDQLRAFGSVIIDYDAETLRVARRR